MAAKFMSPVTFRHTDANTNRQFDNLDKRVREITKRPAVGGEVYLDVELPNGTTILIPHGLGQPASVFPTPPRGGSTIGIIEEVRDASVDRSKYVQLKAKGFGATVTVDLWVL